MDGLQRIVQGVDDSIEQLDDLDSTARQIAMDPNMSQRELNPQSIGRSKNNFNSIKNLNGQLE